MLPAAEVCSGDADVSAVASSLDPTLACVDDDDAAPTGAVTEGPYFKPSSPERTSLLEAGMGGTPLLVSGAVLAQSCQPVKGALGKYFLETVVPGLYPGRTRHIHVKVQAPGQPILTTQLFFPGEPRNAQDGIYRDSLLLKVWDQGARGPASSTSWWTWPEPTRG